MTKKAGGRQKKLRLKELAAEWRCPKCRAALFRRSYKTVVCYLHLRVVPIKGIAGRLFSLHWSVVCYHCGWTGELPQLPFDPTKLKGWAKKAYDAGWLPPNGWTP